ncbi:GNAT family N-acetyltransferase [Phaeovulum sp.]|uniref:GNAT family N-acetyltransferase n=1 Tax=Phaeovulum sp. TaxID=2934796 RepID=UPI0039E6CDFE
MTPVDLATLHAACFVTPRPWSASEIVALLALPGCFLETGPHGFLIGRAIAGEAELLTLAVAPTARRLGTGRALVARFAQSARTLGADTAFLEVAACNTAARALYLGLGWHESGLRRRYYHHPDGRAEDAIVMTRAL